MARNSVQFQKGLSETRFDERYGSEDRCREAVFGWRWPQPPDHIKTVIVGTYRAIRDKHVPRYLAEFEYRFNRRRSRHAAFRSLLGIAVALDPITYNMLIEPEATA